MGIFHLCYKSLASTCNWSFPTKWAFQPTSPECSIRSKINRTWVERLTEGICHNQCHTEYLGISNLALYQISIFNKLICSLLAWVNNSCMFYSINSNKLEKLWAASATDSTSFKDTIQLYAYVKHICEQFIFPHCTGFHSSSNASHPLVVELTLSSVVKRDTTVPYL